MKPITYPTHILLAAMAVMPVLHFLWPGAVLVPVPWTLLGLIPVAGGVLLNLSADGALHKAGTTVKPDETTSALVTGGAYRISRNPMYMGFLMILAGIALLLGSLTPWIVAPLYAVVIDRGFIASEERALSTRFGRDWTEYASRVRRWL